MDLLEQAENCRASGRSCMSPGGHEQEREGSKPIVFERICFLRQGRASLRKSKRETGHRGRCYSPDGRGCPRLGLEGGHGEKRERAGRLPIERDSELRAYPSREGFRGHSGKRILCFCCSVDGGTVVLRDAAERELRTEGDACS